MLKMTNVSFAFEKQSIFEDLSLELKKGEIKDYTFCKARILRYQLRRMKRSAFFLLKPLSFR